MTNLIKLAVIVAMLVYMAWPAHSEPTWNGKTLRQLMSEYNCAWVASERKIYSDEELVAKAKALGLPSYVIEAAKRCPR